MIFPRCTESDISTCCEIEMARLRSFDAMRPRKTDNNQASIVRALNHIPGVSVTDTHALGFGFPDLCVGYRGRNLLVELKNPRQPKSGQQLTEAEEHFRARWKGQLIIVTSLGEILDAIAIETQMREP